MKIFGSSNLFSPKKVTSQFVFGRIERNALGVTQSLEGGWAFNEFSASLLTPLHKEILAGLDSFLGRIKAARILAARKSALKCY